MLQKNSPIYCIETLASALWLQGFLLPTTLLTGQNFVPTALLRRGMGIPEHMCLECEGISTDGFSCCCHYVPFPNSLPGRAPGTTTTTTTTITLL